MAKKLTSGKASAKEKKTAKKRAAKPSDSTQTASSGGEDRHDSTKAYIDYMRPRPPRVELARVLKKTGSFSDHCDSHAWHSAERGLFNA